MSTHTAKLSTSGRVVYLYILQEVEHSLLECIGLHKGAAHREAGGEEKLLDDLCAKILRRRLPLEDLISKLIEHSPLCY